MAKFRTNHKATSKGTALRAVLLVLLFIGLMLAIFQTFMRLP